MDKNKLSNIRIAIFDFDGVFTDNHVYVFENGMEAVSCWRSDGLGLSKLKEININIYVVSTEENPVVGERCKKLGLDYFQGCNDKLIVLKALIKKHKCSYDEVLYVGNDINDADCLKSAGLAVVVADAHEDVVELSDYVTKNRGGRGAVREVCDLLVNSINN
jgi:YrbI family 3-deoxy-D-manno-octulosonate 8-phosphate phosphatase